MKIYRGIMAVIINSVGAALVVPISQRFNTQFNLFVSAILAGVVSAFIIIVLKAILLELPYLIRGLRKQLLPIAEMEGVWVEVVNTPSERVVSIANIEYDIIKKSHKYYGTAFDRDGNEKATWISNHLSHESGDNVHAFTFTGEGTYIESNQRVRTVGQVSFRSLDPFHPHRLSTGHGAYYDYDVNDNHIGISETQNTFNIYRLTQKDYKKYINKRKLKSREDKKQFVINYYKANVRSTDNIKN